MMRMRITTLTTICMCVGNLWAEESPISKIEFLPPNQAANLLVGESDDAFLSNLQPREAAAMTKIPRGEKTAEESQIEARKVFRNSVMEFTSAESDAVRKAVVDVRKEFSDLYPRLVNRDWRFIKIRRTLCGGFSFTRGDCIVFSEPTLAMFVDAARPGSSKARNAASLLLHEQMHCLQREQPALFVPLYERVFGFEMQEVDVHPWVETRQISNPDGLSNDWIVKVQQADQQQAYWMGTLLLGDKVLHRMGYDFTTVAIPVQRTTAGTYAMKLDDDDQPQFKDLKELPQITSRWPIRGGYDHPNEVAAYLFTVIAKGPSPRPDAITPEARDVLLKGTEWFKTSFRKPE